MGKLIDADALLETIEKHSYQVRYDRASVEMGMNLTGIRQAISEQPEAVVRCKDCKHRPTGDAYEHDLEFPDHKCPCQCEDYWYSWMPDDDWYCANGERREDE